MKWTLPRKEDSVILIVPPVVVIESRTLVYAHRLYLESFHSQRLHQWLSQRCASATLINCADDPQSVPMSRGWRTAGPRSVRPRELPCHYFGLEKDVLLQRLSFLDRPNQIWITCSHVYNRDAARETIEVVREAYPDVPIILGGAYASVCPEDARRIGADCVYTGILEEAETPISVQKGAAGFVVVGRGCPRKCSFCAQHYVENHRYMNDVGKIIRAVDRMIDRGMSLLFPYMSSIFTTTSSGESERLLAELSQRDLSLLLWTGLEPQTVTASRAESLKAAGATDIMIPLQTLAQDTAKQWGRRPGPQAYLDAISMVRDAGFHNDLIASDILVGHPGQRLEEAIRSACFVWSQGISPLLFVYALVPGSTDAKNWAHLLADLPLESRHPHLWPFADPRHPVYHFMQFGILGRVLPQMIDKALEYLDPDTPVPGLIRRYLDEFGFDVPQWKIDAPLPVLRPGYQTFLSHPWELVLTLLRTGYSEAALPLVDRCVDVEVCAPEYLEIPRRFVSSGHPDAAEKMMRGAARWLPKQSRDFVLAELDVPQRTTLERFAGIARLVADALEANGEPRESAYWREIGHSKGDRVESVRIEAGPVPKPLSSLPRDSRQAR